MRFLFLLAVVAILGMLPPVPAEAGKVVYMIKKADRHAGHRRYVRTFDRRHGHRHKHCHCTVIALNGEDDDDEAIVLVPSPYAQSFQPVTRPWSYHVFRRHADFGQASHLWQSHLKPSPGYRTRIIVEN